VTAGGSETAWLGLQHWRRMTSVLVAWTAFCALGLIVQLTHNHSAGYQVCLKGGLPPDTCQENYGYGPRPTLIVVVWLVVFACCGAVWFLTRPELRDCSACGAEIQTPRTTCSRCGYDSERASRLLTFALLAVLFLTLVFYWSGTEAVDAGTCSSDLVTTHRANQVVVVGAAFAGALAYTLFVLAVPGRLGVSRWRYVVGVPLGLGIVLALGVAAALVPIVGLVPGLDCSG
jgi:hypothetical protein